MLGLWGSIPVSGLDYIKYGGDTTCMEIRSKSNDIIIVDAGTGIRKLGAKLMEEKQVSYNFIFTHAHWDHLMGFPFFKPLYHKKTKINVFRCPLSGKYVENMISRVLAPPYFPVKYSDLSAEILYAEGCPDKFDIGSITVEPIRLSHPNGGTGFRFIEDGKVFVFLTDNELGFVHQGGLKAEKYVEFSANADLLIHDAEFTPQEYKTSIEWGHSTYTEALDLAIKAGVRKVGLFHLNQERTDAQMDEIVEICNQSIKDKKENVECFAVGSGMTFEL